MDVQRVLDVSNDQIYHLLANDCWLLLITFFSQNINVHIDENALHEILNEVDLNKNGQVEIDEFLQVTR